MSFGAPRTGGEVRRCFMRSRASVPRQQQWQGGSRNRYFQGTTHNDRRFRGMPYFNFDLVIGQELKNQGGMILEDLTTAADRADQLAVELCIVRPELRSRGYAIRVTDDGET
jgi:hypothetical protein